ncbi:MAG: hypothetical protein KDC11_05915 [Chitinophagaceae bacterium]|nr:hypothetical protein [Chitinophagaceae bacterium]
MKYIPTLIVLLLTATLLSCRGDFYCTCYIYEHNFPSDETVYRGSYNRIISNQPNRTKAKRACRANNSEDVISDTSSRSHDCELGSRVRY